MQHDSSYEQIVYDFPVIYHKQIFDDGKDNIIYSFTSRYALPTYRFYADSLLKRDLGLEICLTIDQVFPIR